MAVLNAGTRNPPAVLHPQLYTLIFFLVKTLFNSGINETQTLI